MLHGAGGWRLFGPRAAEREEDTLTGARSEQSPDTRRLSDPEKADVEPGAAPAARSSTYSGSHGACSFHRTGMAYGRNIDRERHTATALGLITHRARRWIR